MTKSTFEGEARNAMALATKLIEEHGLSMSQVEMSDDGHIKDSGIVENATKEWDIWPWEQGIANVVHNLIPVEYFYRRRTKKKSIVFIGTESDSALAIEVYNIFRQELLKISRDEPSPVERRSFLQGCIDTLSSRSRDIRLKREEVITRARSKTESTLKTGISGTELMIIKQKDIKEWMEENIKLSMFNSRGSAVFGDSYNRGAIAGKSINLNFQKAIN